MNTYIPLAKKQSILCIKGTFSHTYKKLNARKTISPAGEVSESTIGLATTQLGRFLSRESETFSV
jgi:hypothetical protein